MWPIGGIRTREDIKRSEDEWVNTDAIQLLLSAISDFLPSVVQVPAEEVKEFYIPNWRWGRLSVRVKIKDLFILERAEGGIGYRRRQFSGRKDVDIHICDDGAIKYCLVPSFWRRCVAKFPFFSYLLEEETYWSQAVSLLKLQTARLLFVQTKKEFLRKLLEKLDRLSDEHECALAMTNAILSLAQ